MKDYKNYKSYFIHTKTWKEQEKIKTINELLKAKKNDIIALDEWEKRRKAEYLTEKQAKLFYNNNIKELKELLTKYKIKAIDKLEEAKAKALEEYEQIKELKGVKSATFEICWSNSRGADGYQCRCYSTIEYLNGKHLYYEGEKTGGCGYDKPSSALSYNMNNTCKILLLKNDKKIINSKNKHYDFYSCENLYFSYGVGINSYITMFKNLGYKTNVFCHHNEDITITIKK